MRPTSRGRCVYTVDTCTYPVEAVYGISFGGPSRDRHLPWRARLDAVPERRHRPPRRQHGVRVGAVARRASAAVRPRHRAALLRRVDALRRAVRRHLPAQPPALGPRAGTAVLQAAAAQRRPPVDPRPDAVRRPPSGRGAAEHDPPAAVPDLARRVQRRRHDPLRQAAVLRRLVRRALRRRAAQRADGRLPRRARRPQRHLHQRPPTARRPERRSPTRCSSCAAASTC